MKRMERAPGRKHIFAKSSHSGWLLSRNDFPGAATPPQSSFSNYFSLSISVGEVYKHPVNHVSKISHAPESVLVD